MRRRAGFTLIELLVVLLLMGLAAALVAPTLLSPRHGEPGLNPLLARARSFAARRGETVYLRITPAGEWRMEGAADPREGTLATGHLQESLEMPVTLVVSPMGTCGFDVETAAAARGVALHALTCEVRRP